MQIGHSTFDCIASLAQFAQFECMQGYITGSVYISQQIGQTKTSFRPSRALIIDISCSVDSLRRPVGEVVAISTFFGGATGSTKAIGT